MLKEQNGQNYNLYVQVDVTIAGVAGTAPVKCSRNVVVTPDAGLDAVKDQKFDAIICPGGMGGAKSLAAVRILL